MTAYVAQGQYILTDDVVMEISDMTSDPRMAASYSMVQKLSSRYGAGGDNELELLTDAYSIVYSKASSSSSVGYGQTTIIKGNVDCIFSEWFNGISVGQNEYIQPISVDGQDTKFRAQSIFSNKYYICCNLSSDASEVSSNLNSNGTYKLIVDNNTGIAGYELTVDNGSKTIGVDTTLNSE